jgi:hypothetical protein
MRQFLTVVLVAALVWLGWKFSHYAQEKIGSNPAQQDAAEAPAKGKLPGMAASLEGGYEDAKREGAEGVRKWLTQHRSEIREPRLTDIELDYVLFLRGSNQAEAAEAKRILAGIKARIKPTSSVYKRFEQLAKTYE